MTKISLLKKYASMRFSTKIIIGFIECILFIVVAFSYANGGYEYITPITKYHGLIPYSWYASIGEFVLDGENGDSPVMGIIVFLTILVPMFCFGLVKKPLSFLVTTLIMVLIILFSITFIFF